MVFKYTLHEVGFYIYTQTSFRLSFNNQDAQCVGLNKGEGSFRSDVEKSYVSTYNSCREKGDGVPEFDTSSMSLPSSTSSSFWVAETAQSTPGGRDGKYFYTNKGIKLRSHVGTLSTIRGKTDCPYTTGCRPR